MRILRFATSDGRVLLGDDRDDGTATVLIDGHGILGPRQGERAAREMLRGLRALVADDDDGILLTIRKTLEKFECRCTICRDGAEAIDAIQHDEFDLVVSDIVMPHQSGYDVFAAAKEQSRLRPVVLITGFGYDPNHAVVKASNEGLEGVLFKPFTPGQFIEKIADAISCSTNGQNGAFVRSTECVTVKRILSPVTSGDVLCIGRNYPDFDADGDEPPGELELFMKPSSALLDPGHAIRVPRIGEADPLVDCEGELAVIIGSEVSNVDEAEALDHVLGVTAANDVTARRWQATSSPHTWMRGKGFDTFCPIGPVIVTLENVDLDQGLDITTSINGHVVRNGNTGRMIRPVARLISELSRHITLKSGTVLLTGAPPTDPSVSEPGRSLQDGDEVCVEIEGIGKLVNTVLGP